MSTAAWLIFPLLGGVAGVLAGLLGIGGGIVLVAALVLLLPLLGVPEAQAIHVALGTSLASIVVTALASTRGHWQRGSVHWASVAWLAPGLVLGAALGSRLAHGLDAQTLQWVVGGFCLLIAFRMATATPPDHEARGLVGGGLLLTLAGLGIGAISAVVGIGGGSLTVPLLVARGARAVEAVGTSSACGVVIGLASAASYAAAAGPEVAVTGVVGLVHVPAALGIAVGSVLTAPLGVALAHRLRGPALARVFALVLAIVGISLCLKTV